MALRRELYLVSMLVGISILMSQVQVRAYRGHLVGGRSEVSDVKTNKEVQALGRFSVDEYNRLQEEGNGGGIRKLTFTEVVEAQRQVVSGIKYYLKVLTMQNGGIKVFESVVVVKPWVHSKELLHFAPSSTSGLKLYVN